MWYSGHLSFHHHYHYLNSYTGFLLHFMLSTLTYRGLSTQQPPYLASLLHLSNIRRQLISSILQQHFMPKTKFYLGKRAFSVAADRVWNELPVTLKTFETIAIFRQKLKTYLFQIAFPPQIFKYAHMSDSEPAWIHPKFTFV